LESGVLRGATVLTVVVDREFAVASNAEYLPYQASLFGIRLPET
jgi:hypothetical protein